MVYIDIEDLPDWRLLEEVATKLFSLFDGEANGYVSREEVVDACLLYDDHVRVDEIEDTFKAIMLFCLRLIRRWRQRVLTMTNFACGAC